MYIQIYMDKGEHDKGEHLREMLPNISVQVKCSILGSNRVRMKISGYNSLFQGKKIALYTALDA